MPVAEPLGARNPWWTVVGAAIALAVGSGPVLFYCFGLFLQPIAAEFEASRASIALAPTISALATVAGMPIVGRLTDRFGVRTVVFGCVTLQSLSLASLGLATPSLPVFIALFALSGFIGAGTTALPYVKAISGWFDERRGLALGIAIAGMGVGSSLVPQLARALIDDFGWRGAYVGLALLHIVVALSAVALLVRDPPGQRRANDGHEALGTANGFTPAQALRDRRFWQICLALFLAGGFVGVAPHLVAILTEQGYTRAAATSMLSLFGVVTIIGRLGTGYFLDRFFAPYVAAATFLVALIGTVLLGSGATGAATVLAIVCLALSVGGENDVIAYLTGRYFGLRQFGEIYGYLVISFVLGNSLGPYLLGYSYDAVHSYAPALWGFAGALCVAAMVITRIGPYVYPAESLRPRAATAVEPSLKTS